MCISSPSYWACNAHAPYCYLWPTQLYNVFFPHYLINGTIFEKKKLLNTKCVLIFYTIFVWNFSRSKEKLARLDKNVYWSSCILYSYPILLKIEFSWQIFEKSLKYQISWKSVRWEPSCFMLTEGRTGGRTDGMTFRYFAKAPKNCATKRKRSLCDIQYINRYKDTFLTMQITLRQMEE